MKHNLKLTLICITVLMTICGDFTTADAQKPTVEIQAEPETPANPSVGDTLRYRVFIRNAGDVIGFRITYSDPRDIAIAANWSIGTYRVSGTHNFETSTFESSTRFIDLPLRPIFNLELSDLFAGTGEIRVTGTLRMHPRATFNPGGTINVDVSLPITISAPAGFIPEPAVPVPPPEPLPVPVEDVVSIPDANLAAAVRKALDLGSNAIIIKQMMQRLTELDARNSQIKNLTGLEHATQLRLLELRENQISDIRPLANLKRLKRLILDDNRVRDINPLANLTQLTWLLIGGNPIADFTPLNNLNQLEGLTIWDSNISDITLLTDMTKLANLWLGRNKINDVTPLANLTQLRILYLPHNQISDVTPLAGLANLETLHLQDNSIRDVSPLTGLTKLTELRIEKNPIADKSPLRTLKERNPQLRIEHIEIPPLSPVVHIDPAQRPPLYWISATTGTLHRLIGDEVENLLPTVKNATGLAVDMAGGKLYWTEKTGERTGRIRRASLDGTNIQLVKNLTSVPHGIALDAANGRIYLTNAWGKVQRLNVDGSNFQPNFITNLNAPKHIALDVAGSKIYWTEATEGLGRIRRANLDGSSVQNVVTNLTEPLPLAVITGKLYWTNGTRENKGELQRADLNSFNREVLQTLPIAPTNIAVDPVHRLLYLTLPSGEIHRRNLDGLEYQPVVTGLASPSNTVLGISATDPVPTDTPAPPAEPTGDTVADVNQDQKVNKTDLLLVVTALGESPPANPNFDVNADGTVNIADVLLVIEELDDPITAAAPTNEWRLEMSLDPSLLAAQLNILRAENDGSAKYESVIAFLQGLLVSVRPTETQLLANYPNPFNPETWIPYQLAEETSDVKITIYDARGVVVRQLDLGHQPAGIYHNRSRAAYWDGRNALGEKVASGLYVYTLSTGNFTATRKMLIRK